MKRTRKLLACLLAVFTMILAIPAVNAEAATLTGGTTKAKAKAITPFATDHYTKIKYDETRWFKFKTKSYNGYYTITLKNVSYGNRVHIYLMDQNEEEIAGDSYVYKNDSVSWNYKLKKNSWYYISIHGNHSECVGNIKMSVSARKDGEGDYKTGCKVIKNKQTLLGHIDGRNDRDFFKFVAPTSGKYRFIVKNVSVGTNFRADVINSYDEELSTDSYIYKNEAFDSCISVTKGKTYYIRIQGYDNTYVGNYKVRVQKK